MIRNLTDKHSRNGTELRQLKLQGTKYYLQELDIEEQLLYEESFEEEDYDLAIIAFSVRSGIMVTKEQLRRVPAKPTPEWLDLEDLTEQESQKKGKSNKATQKQPPAP